MGVEKVEGGRKEVLTNDRRSPKQMNPLFLRGGRGQRRVRGGGLEAGGGLEGGGGWRVEGEGGLEGVQGDCVRGGGFAPPLLWHVVQCPSGVAALFCL